MLDNPAALIQSRNEYAYPPFCLRRCDSAVTADAVLWNEAVVISGPSEADAPKFASFSSLELDQYHHRLLRSEHDDLVLLGVASVTFWGFSLGPLGRYTKTRALARAKIVAGLGRRSGDSASTITRSVRTIARCLDQGRRQDAIMEAMSLRHHGLAFASKLLAFSAPATECVYDDVISRRLELNDDPRLKRLYVNTKGKHRLSEKAGAYEGWAQLCSAKANELNRDSKRWRDWNGELRLWRAVDVERAFFSLGRT